MKTLLEFLIPYAYAIPLPSDISGVPQLTTSTDFILVIVRILQGLAASVATLYIVIAGYFYIIARGDEGAIKKAKDSVMNSAIGLIVIALAQSIGSIFDPAVGINIGGANIIIISITNFLLALIGGVAIIYFVYGGYTYITAAGDQGKVSKATKAIWNSIAGILIAIFAYTIVTIVLTGGQGTAPAPSSESGGPKTPAASPSTAPATPGGVLSNIGVGL